MILAGILLLPLSCGSVRGFTLLPSSSSRSVLPGTEQTTRLQQTVPEQHDDEETNERQRAPTGRRSVLSLGLALLTASGASAGIADAYDREFPIELQPVTSEEEAKSRELKKSAILRQDQAMKKSPLSATFDKPVGASLWGAALWLLGGSRSNPLITPLANILYDPNEEDWLQDRNDGLFANIPAPLYAVLAIVLITAGIGADALVTILADGNRNTSLQLAGVSLIGGASLELGRLASGQKGQTRQESDREEQLRAEFFEFANERLQLGRSANCHKSEVVQAFRRYFAKYRQADTDDEEYAVADLEIERLLRDWSKPQSNISRTSAGFYYGIQVNADADAFVQR